MQCKLTLVTAPPGYGKSTIVSDWVRNERINACWLSLDEGDNDVLRFWTYLTASLAAVHPAMNSVQEDLLQPELMLSLEQLAGNLINKLVDVSEHIVMIFDDYHHIDNPEVHRFVSLLIQHMPSQIHICLISRTESPFPIGALRAKGQINDMNSQELKFTKDEISDYWLHQTGVFPHQSILQCLTEVTEGWIAGIQLASLSEQSGQKGTLSHFNGSHRYIVDYLMEEVFQHLPHDLKLFLMKTSILHRMNSDLCNVLTAQNDSQQFLRHIEQSNYFLIPLDSQLYWYRYHHLFADFLTSHLKKELPNEYKNLHEKASQWFSQHGYKEEAVPYAIAAGNYELAVELILSIVTNLLRRREVTTLQKWLQQLPAKIIERPEILILLTWTDMLSGKYENVNLYLGKIKAILQEEKTHEQAIRLNEELFVLKNLNALIMGDYDSAIELLSQLAEREKMPDVKIWLDYGIELNPGELPFIRSYYGMNGRVNKAFQFHQLYHTFIEKNDYQDSAYAAYQRAAFSEIYYERNQDDLAMEYAAEAIKLAKSYRLIGAYIPAVIVKSKVDWSRGNAVLSIESLNRAKDYLKELNRHTSYWSKLVSSQLVRFELAKGEMGKFDLWLEACHFQEQAEILPNQEFELLVYIHGLMEKRQFSLAVGWAKRVLNQAQQNGRIMIVLESKLYLAELYRRQGLAFESMEHLNQAIKLGEEHGYLRIFTDIGFPPKELFQQYLLVKNKRQHLEMVTGVSNEYITSILELVGVYDKSSDRAGVHTLTTRELEVLQLLSMGLSNREIAAKLVLSEGTVKIHLNRVYSKLGVKGRVEAIQKVNKTN